MSKRFYILYDQRAIDGSTSDASVLVICESAREAKSCRKDFGACCCYSYAEDGKNLIDEKCEWVSYE